MPRLPTTLPGVLWRLPAFPGKLRVLDGIAKFAGRVSDGRAVCSPRPGMRLELDLRDRIQRQMWAGCYEPHVRKCCEALLQKGDSFVDVGAHIGYHSVIAACAVGPEGKVFAFEPDPELYGRLVQNARHFPWVRAVPHAVWESSGTQEFEQSTEPGESGWGSLTTVRNLGGHHTAVPVVSLDDWSAEYPPEGLRAIKIDAEGSELRILRGARRLIASYRPTMVVEFNDVVLRQAGTSSAELAGLLVSLRYHLFGLSWPYLEHAVDGVVPDASEVLCIAEEQAEATLERLRQAGFVKR